MNIRKPGDTPRSTTTRSDKRAGGPTRVRGDDGVRRVTDVSAQEHAERDESSYERERTSYQPRSIGPHEKTPLPGQRLGGALSSPQRSGAQLRHPGAVPKMEAGTAGGAPGGAVRGEGALRQLAQRLAHSYAAAPAERQAAVFAEVFEPRVVQNLMGLVMQRLDENA